MKKVKLFLYFFILICTFSMQALVLDDVTIDENNNVGAKNNKPDKVTIKFHNYPDDITNNLKMLVNNVQLADDEYTLINERIKAYYFILIDNSGSMKTKDLNAIKTNVLYFLSRVNPKDEVQIDTISNYLSTIYELAPYKTSVNAKIKAIQQEGNYSHLYDALYELNNNVNALKAKNPNNLYYIILFSDGEDTLSDITPKQLLKYYKNIPLYYFCYSSDYKEKPNKPIVELTKDNGKFYNYLDTNMIDSLFFSNENRYTLDFYISKKHVLESNSYLIELSKKTTNDGKIIIDLRKYFDAKNGNYSDMILDAPLDQNMYNNLKGNLRHDSQLDVSLLPPIATNDNQSTQGQSSQDNSTKSNENNENQTENNNNKNSSDNSNNYESKNVGIVPIATNTNNSNNNTTNDNVNNNKKQNNYNNDNEKSSNSQDLNTNVKSSTEQNVNNIDNNNRENSEKTNKNIQNTENTTETNTKSSESEQNNKENNQNSDILSTTSDNTNDSVGINNNNNQQNLSKNSNNGQKNKKNSNFNWRLLLLILLILILLILLILFIIWLIRKIADSHQPVVSGGRSSGGIERTPIETYTPPTPVTSNSTSSKQAQKPKTTNVKIKYRISKDLKTKQTKDQLKQNGKATYVDQAERTGETVKVGSNITIIEILDDYIVGASTTMFLIDDNVKIKDNDFTIRRARYSNKQYTYEIIPNNPEYDIKSNIKLSDNVVTMEKTVSVYGDKESIINKMLVPANIQIVSPTWFEGTLDSKQGKTLTSNQPLYLDVIIEVQEGSKTNQYLITDLKYDNKKYIAVLQPISK